MTENKYKKDWENFRDKELEVITPILNNLGFELEKKQVHIKGERFISCGKKLILVGKRRKDKRRVIIKLSSSKKEIDEIEAERKNRVLLNSIDFAYKTFRSPQEIIFIKKQGFAILITEFIEQSKTFLEREINEQFFLALKAFEAQESVHATTKKHLSKVRDEFGVMKFSNYLKKFKKSKKTILLNNKNEKNLKELLEKCEKLFKSSSKIINLYGDFLVNWDFVPHNIRVRSGSIYLLDHSSFRFGNKYESWARFLNFMTLYNPALESLLLNYVVNNRDKEEQKSLQAMRIFRAVELISYYSKAKTKSSDKLKELSEARIEFWSKVLEAILDNKKVDKRIIENYKKKRDSLRSKEEKNRQKGLH